MPCQHKRFTITSQIYGVFMPFNSYCIVLQEIAYSIVPVELTGISILCNVDTYILIKAPVLFIF